MRIEYLLKEIREKKKLSLRDMEKITGVSKSELQSLENGDREPFFSTLVKISVGLSIDIEKLYKIHY